MTEANAHFLKNKTPSARVSNLGQFKNYFPIWEFWSKNKIDLILLEQF